MPIWSPRRPPSPSMSPGPRIRRQCGRRRPPKASSPSAWPRSTKRRCSATTGRPLQRPGPRRPSGSRWPRPAPTRVAEKSLGLPRLMGSLRAGEISFDKVRTVVDVATPKTDRALCAQAKNTVRDLAEVARLRAEPSGRFGSDLAFRARQPLPALQRRAPHHVGAVPKESYAQTKACVDALAKTIPNEDEIPLDQRRCDGFIAIVRGGSSALTASRPAPFVVVVHVPLEILVNDEGDPSNWPPSSSTMA